jgi:toxin ParE1/3/4
MPKYSLTKKAVYDLKQIWNYTYDNWTEKQADKYVNQLLNRCLQISKKPLQDRKYENLYPGLKGSKVNKHIIFYRKIEEEQIEVIRILHERMDLRTKFSNE